PCAIPFPTKRLRPSPPSRSFQSLLERRKAHGGPGDLFQGSSLSHVLRFALLRFHCCRCALKSEFRAGGPRQIPVDRLAAVTASSETCRATRSRERSTLRSKSPASPGAALPDLEG